MEEVESLYSALHEATEGKFVGVAEACATTLPSPLKTIRKARGMSQAQLSASSGVSPRAIQQYEQRAKDINKAQLSAAYKLAQTLGCRMEDLLEFPLA